MNNKTKETFERNKGKGREGQREGGIDIRIAVFTKKRGEKRKRIYPSEKGVETPTSLCMF